MKKRIMRQLLIFAPIAAIFAVAAGTASAHRGHDHGVAFGRAHFTVAVGQDERIGFVAKDRGAKLDDRGFVVYRNATAGFTYDTEIACAAVKGNRARFGYVIPNEPDVPASIRGLGVVFEVVDNGAPGAGKDLIGYVSGPAAIASACASTPVPNLTAIRAGNIVVKSGKEDRKKHRDDDTDDSTDDTTDDTDE